MLLCEWVAELGLPCDRSRMHLGQVQRFIFGERYAVEMTDGRVYEDKDLDRLLEVVHSEFTAHNNAVIIGTGITNHPDILEPHMEVRSIGARRGIGRADQRSLCIVPMMIGRLPTALRNAVNMDELVTVVRDAITFYNLSGDWTSFKKDNL